MKFIKNNRLYCYEQGTQKAFRIVEMTSGKVHVKPCNDATIEFVHRYSEFLKKYWIPTGKCILA